MSLIVDVATEGVRVPLARARIVALAQAVLRAERVPHAMLSITFVSNRAMARLNREHLQHDGPTDVISFGFTRETERDPVVGDIYVAPDVARAAARAHGTGVREEVARYVVHGVLHVLGHDHPDGEARLGAPMWKRQESLLRRLASHWRA